MDRRSFYSAYPFLQHLNIQDTFCEYLVWAKASIDDSPQETTFYYQNIIDYVHYLVRQVTYSRYTLHTYSRI